MNENEPERLGRTRGEIVYAWALVAVMFFLLLVLPAVAKSVADPASHAEGRTMNGDPAPIRYIQTDQEEWSLERLQQRISENVRLLAKVAAMQSDPALDRIRALLERDLEHKRALLATLR